VNEFSEIVKAAVLKSHTALIAPGVFSDDPVSFFESMSMPKPRYISGCVVNVRKRPRLSPGGLMWIKGHIKPMLTTATADIISQEIACTLDPDYALLCKSYHTVTELRGVSEIYVGIDITPDAVSRADIDQFVARYTLCWAWTMLDVYKSRR